MSTYTRGLLITAAGVVAITPDALLIRLAAIDAWTMVFWRGLGIAAGLSLFIRAVEGRAAFRDLFRPDRRRFAACLLIGAGNACFIWAVTLTAASNVLVIVASTPLAAAVLSRLFLAERVAPRTWVAALAVLGAVLAIFVEELEGGRYAGNVFAVGATVLLAAYFVAIRAMRTLRVISIPVWGNLAAALAVLPLAAPFSVPAASVPWLALLSLVVMPVALSLITVGPRYLPAPEVGLLLLLETILGPLWVWLAIGEEPARTTMIAGAAVVLVLVLHTALGLRSAARGEGEP